MNQTEAIKKAEDRLNLCIHISECSENKGRDKRRSTMSEIERAIEYYKENEFYMQKYNADLVTMKMNELALTALKEKLEREKNPLTCEGCELSELAKYHPFQIVQCSECSRQNGRTDRYEPKGEPNV